MANLGFQAVYGLLNGIDNCVCERAFLPEREDLPEYERTGSSLFSLESQTPLREFDLIAFSVPFEDDYFNIPSILRLAGIAPRSADRSGPLVMAGGVAVGLNPEPLSDFIDFFMLGDAEGAAGPVIESLMECRSNGLGKQESLKALDSIDWVYVPSFYAFEYDGIHIKSMSAIDGAKKVVRASKARDLDKYPVPQSFVYTPRTELPDTYCVEAERGCPRGCRFCAAGFLYLPPRMRDEKKVLEAVSAGLKRSGKVGLVGTAVSEYPAIKEVLKHGIDEGGTITLSSLRLDELDHEFLALLKEAGYRTITLAPEAGSSRMRDIVNKGITEEEVMESVRLIAEAGFTRLKLYFLVGLPCETDEDALGISELTKKIREVFRKGGEIMLSVNPFVPKPFTPFQWHRFEDAAVVDRRLKLIKKELAKTGVKVMEMSAKEAYMQAFLARADRRAAEIIEKASMHGWKKAMKGMEAFIEESVYSGRGKEEILPWDIIDHGVKKGYFWKEFQKGLEGRQTPPCDVGSCVRCGVC
ncbi:MAG: radical SAM protein [Deltaproteobacteria bacterium]|nr:radical SAM protein [Deltaproteobacteria bacterium]